MSFVLDASMTLACLFEDESPKATAAVLAKVAEAGVTVPAIWRLEVANGFRTSVRRRRCTEDYVDESLNNLRELPIVTDPETDARAWEAILELSRIENLTPYDAAYLELAIRLDATLASCDADLVAAARRRGLNVLTV
ncbi:type II toxin-antitoxin system VapC family toxin [Caulobacter sp. LARHSG274]